MHATCATCHATGDVGDELHELTEVGGEGPSDARTIHLCEDCLDRRETSQWPLAGEAGQRLYEALDSQPHAPRERYSYLLEPDQRLHLVRLRPDWVQQHAEA